MKHDNSAEQVRIVGVAFGAIQKGPEAIDLDETETAEHGVVAEAEIEYVEREETQAVYVKPGSVHVVVAQTQRVCL